MGRRRKGEGTTYKTIRKVKRSKFKKEICAICKECANRCDREHFERCEKCINCKEECLKYCDRYYCKKVFVSQATINGKQVTITTKEKEKEAVFLKKKALNKLDDGKYIDKNNITLSEVLNNLEDSKLKKNEITENSYNRNKCTIKKIDSIGLGSIPIQKIRIENIENALCLDEVLNLSQSSIDKIYDELNAGFKKAIQNKIVSENIIKLIKKPISKKAKKVAVPFTVEEEKKLITFLQNNKVLIDPKIKYDSTTLKNLILLALFTGMRIGEIGALDYINDIDFDKKYIKVSKTLTKEKDTNKIIIGKTTKTGRISRKNRRLDFRIVPFQIFNQNIVENLLKEQIEIVKRLNNEKHLLFCQTDGNYINHSKITNIFKKICRELKIKNDLPDGCHIHMTKHTFVTRCVEAGIELITISNIVGTTTRVLEKTYAHILLEFQNKELIKLNNYYKENAIIKQNN